MDKVQMIYYSVGLGVVTTIALLFFWWADRQMSPGNIDHNVYEYSLHREKMMSDASDAQTALEKHPISIESLRETVYEGGDFVIEEVLPNGINYKQYIVSYRSEGLKIYGLLTIPDIKKPDEGFPAIIFVHGYIPPKQYSTIKDYPTYQATLARAGFVTFKPDLRGHGNSEGEPVSAHFSEKYVVDVLHAIAYMKEHSDIDAERIGYWGHSNGGGIGLRIAVVSDDVAAFALWAGVVGSYEDMFETHIEDIPFLRDRGNPLVDKFGIPSDGDDFWRTAEPYNYLNDIKAPIALHHGTHDTSVPIVLSESLEINLKIAGREVDLYRYEGDDHNIGTNASLAWQRTIQFFNEKMMAQ